MEPLGFAGQPRRPSLREICSFRDMFFRRKLPHLQRDNKRHFVTFRTFQRWILPEAARAISLRCCLHDNDRKHFLPAVVVMPDHVHLIFTPLINAQKSEFYPLAEIMGAIKGASAQLINRELGRTRHVWQTESFDVVLRSSESLMQRSLISSGIRSERGWPTTGETIVGFGCGVKVRAPRFLFHRSHLVRFR